MTALRECSACQIGDHANHYRVVQAVEPGMFGGAVCTCQGECKNKDRDKIYEELMGFPPGVLAKMYRRKARG